MFAAPVPLDIQTGEYTALRADYDLKHQRTNEAWIAELEAAQALYKSNSWKHLAKTWNEYCHAHMPYSAGTYRAYRLNIPIAEIVEEATKMVLSRGEARKLREKIAEIVDESDYKLIPAIWQLCYAYEPKLVPDANVIAEAYEAIKDERDNNSISFNGETIDLKMLAQVQRIKESVLETITSNSKPSKKLQITANQAILALIRQHLPDSVQIPAEGAQVWISWKLEGAGQ